MNHKDPQRTPKVDLAASWAVMTFDMFSLLLIRNTELGGESLGARFVKQSRRALILVRYRQP